MSDELVTLATYRFVPKAEMARALLEQEGFEAFVADATLVTADWLLGGAVGHVKLQVPVSQAEAAAALLKQHPQLLDARYRRSEEDEDSDRCLACGAELQDDDDRCSACGWSYEQEEIELLDSDDPAADEPSDSDGTSPNNSSHDGTSKD